MILSQIVHRFSRFSHRPQGTCLGAPRSASGSWKLREQPSELSTSPLQRRGTSDSSDRTLDELNVTRCSSLVYLGFRCWIWRSEAERNDNITISGSFWIFWMLLAFWRFSSFNPNSTRVYHEMFCQTRFRPWLSRRDWTKLNEGWHGHILYSGRSFQSFPYYNPGSNGTFPLLSLLHVFSRSRAKFPQLGFWCDRRDGPELRSCGSLASQVPPVAPVGCYRIATWFWYILMQHAMIIATHPRPKGSKGQV
jgi:hypothetical protein